MSNSRRYPTQVFWSDEDSGFIAVAPDLPGCSAFGASQAGAIEELQPAIEAWIEAARAAGNPVPQPSRPAEAVKGSGRLLLRMPRELHADLARAAKVEGVSLNQYAVYLLTRHHEASQPSGEVWMLKSDPSVTLGAAPDQLGAHKSTWESVSGYVAVSDVGTTLYSSAGITNRFDPQSPWSNFATVEKL